MICIVSYHSMGKPITTKMLEMMGSETASESSEQDRESEVPEPSSEVVIQTTQ